MALIRKMKTKNNLEVTYKIRVLKSDKPAAQFEGR